MNKVHLLTGRRSAIMVAVLTVAMSGLWLARGPAADAACAAPSLEPAVDQIPAGSHLRVTGERWETCVDVAPSDEKPEPYDDIRVLLVRDGTEHELGRLDAEPGGHVEGTVEVPDDLAAGSYQLLGRTADKSAGSSPEPVQVISGERATSRVGGTDRVATAVMVSQRNFPDGAATVYLARSDVPFDAMVAATAPDGPILLLPGCELPDVVAAEIARVDPAEVVALGGELAVCQQVLTESARG